MRQNGANQPMLEFSDASPHPPRNAKSPLSQRKQDAQSNACEAELTAR
jgi:hypothetical protein